MKPRLPESDSHADELVDVHLRTALRHAPDADAAPPAALSAAILSQARAAASIKQTSTQAEHLAPVWQLLAWLRQGWLALSQPALAAGVASVMVASVVGLMWWDRVPEDVGAPRELSPERSTSSAPPNQKAEAAESATKAATNDAVAAPASSIPAANAPGVVANANKPAVTKAPPATANQQAPTRVASEAAEQRRSVADAAQNDNEVAHNAPTHRAEAPPATAPATLPESTAPRARADAPAPAVTAAAAPAPALKAAPLERESARASGIALGFATSTPVTSLREALRDEPERWAWQKNTAGVALVVPELSGWLAQLESATAGRWAPQLDLRASGAAQKTLLTLRWIRDSQTAHTLVLRADGLLWQKAGAAEPAWFAPLDPGMVKRLMDTLP